MKTRDIADKYQINKSEFENYLKENCLSYDVKGLGSMDVPDAKVYEYVMRFQNKIAREEAERQAAIDEEKAEEERKKKAMAEMLISSGFSFDGYTIVKYSGYISGDDATEIPRGGLVFSSDNGKNLTDALVRIRRQALTELKEAAYNLGCNAVVGVDFDYLTLEPETTSILTKGNTVYLPYVICVTANGNAVVIKKNNDIIQKTTEKIEQKVKKIIDNDDFFTKI